MGLFDGLFEWLKHKIGWKDFNEFHRISPFPVHKIGNIDDRISSNEGESKKDKKCWIIGYG